MEKTTACTLLLPEGTESGLSAEAEDTPALYANASLLIEGAGTLSLRSARGDGLFGREDVILRGGTVTVEAERRGIHTRRTLEITGGDLTVDAGRKGLSARESILLSSGRVTVRAGGDGLSVGQRGDQYLQGAGLLTLSGGEVRIDAYKAPVDAWGGLILTGGSLFGTGRTEKRQTVMEESAQALLLKLSEGEPEERVAVLDTDGSVLFEARPGYAFDLVICSDAHILRGLSYTVESQRASYPARAE